jgi:hypothetical protein
MFSWNESDLRAPSTFLISPIFFCVRPSSLFRFASGLQLIVSGRLAGGFFNVAGDILGGALYFVGSA